MLKPPTMVERQDAQPAVIGQDTQPKGRSHCALKDVGVAQDGSFRPPTCPGCVYDGEVRIQVDCPRALNNGGHA